MYSNVFLLNHHVVIRPFCREMTFSGMALATFITFSIFAHIKSRNFGMMNYINLVLGARPARAAE